MKSVLPSIISTCQTAYVKGRFIGETGRLISDILEITNTLNIGGFLVTVDIEKAFDSLNHNFLIATLELFNFGDNFINWIKILLKNQESCVINGGLTSGYFKLERGARQGDPISAYIFIVALEMVLLAITQNQNIKGIEIFGHEYIYSSYADDTSFSLRDEESIRNTMQIINKFSCFSGLKPNVSKCEIAGIGILKGVHMALCGMKCINLTKNSIKILGLHFSYDKFLQNAKNFQETMINIQRILQIWKMRQLTLEGRILIFKTLAISKIVFLASQTTIPNDMVEKLMKIQEDFVWLGKKTKINYSTLCNSHETGGLKNIDIRAKIISLQCSWVKRLFDDNFHEWKLIPKHLFERTFVIEKCFHSHFKPNAKVNLEPFPVFYINILNKWHTCSTDPIVPSTIFSQYLWFNSLITISNDVIFFKRLHSKGLNYISQLFNEQNGKLKT